MKYLHFQCKVPSLNKVEVPRILQHILSGHPFPLSQGPLKLPVDCNDKTMSEAVTKKTVFWHDDEQMCYEWLPCKTVLAAWDHSEVTFHVKELKWNMHGAASLMDMSIVYSCNQYKGV